mmetsp:Transcript_6987/g.10403  ORF Transcript_6987/g.10403 Transcript_6987/m.10403 type:complete len:326 (+) Transcript_6987:57-1034(+)
MSSFAEKVASQIPSEVHMISGCHDAQTSADANITSFQLPNPAGRAGGACTAALLQVLYDRPSIAAGNDNTSWVQVLRRMRENLDQQGFEQVPQLSSSRIIDVNERMTIVNDNPSGVKRAVLIGINYVGQQGELSGCHNDVKNISSYLQQVQGFRPQNMITLMDDGVHDNPTYDRILQAFQWVVNESQAGDTVWIHYSGHGGRVEDDNGDEDDGYDETLIPVDFQRKGQIRDDDLLRYLVKPMREGVLMTCLMDCCHSGTVLDLPYRFIADGDHYQMERNDDFDMDHLIEVAKIAATVAASLGGMAQSVIQSSGLVEEIDECCVIL